MGTDINVILEVKQSDGKWYEPDTKSVEQQFLDNIGYSDFPFSYRSYGLFGFLADIRNISCVPSVSDHRGLPDDSIWLDKQTYDNGLYDETNREYALEGYYGHTWVTLQELLDFDYDQVFEDRRVNRVMSNPSNSIVIYSGGNTVEEGEGRMISVREFLGEYYFQQLEALKIFGKPSDVRLIIYFD